MTFYIGLFECLSLNFLYICDRFCFVVTMSSDAAWDWSLLVLTLGPFCVRYDASWDQSPLVLDHLIGCTWWAKAICCLCQPWGHLVGVMSWIEAIHHFFQTWWCLVRATTQTNANHLFWALGHLVGATIWAKASCHLCQAWGNLEKAVKRQRLVAICTGLEGISERQWYKPRPATTWVKLKDPQKRLQWVLRPATACGESLEPLEEVRF